MYISKFTYINVLVCTKYNIYKIQTDYIHERNNLKAKFVLIYKKHFAFTKLIAVINNTLNN